MAAPKKKIQSGSEPSVSCKARKQANASAQAVREAANRSSEGPTPWQIAKAARHASRAAKQTAWKINQNKGMGRA